MPAQEGFHTAGEVPAPWPEARGLSRKELPEDEEVNALTLALGSATRPQKRRAGQERNAGYRICVQGFGKGCPCCGDDLDILALRGQNGQNCTAAGGSPASGRSAPWVSEAPEALFGVGRMKEVPEGPFVDTHVHLNEVLQVIRRHQVAPSLGKNLYGFNAEELKHWKTLGWVKEAGTTGWTLPAPLTPTGAAADDKKAADDKQDEGGPTGVWLLTWVQLEPSQRAAAAALGYNEKAWNTSQWLLPRGKPWSEMTPEMREQLTALGESQETWDDWRKGATGGGGEASSSGSSSRGVVDTNDLRRWDALSFKEQEAARALGFSEGTWNSEEMADLEGVIREYFTPVFEGCITQGCDLESLEDAAMLAQRHPKVYVSFGCHPKSAWCYDDAFEEKMLAAARACGKKTVAWGEFGLDYSHPWFGKIAGNRRKQKEVFARQLKLAVSLGYPLVIHSRAADRDTMRMLLRFVPRHWKVHIHSFRGSVQFMEALIRVYENAYFGIPGIVTMADPHAQELARRCPLERVVLETDGPYLPLNGEFVSHPGLIPHIVNKVAELKGRPVKEVYTVTRENARHVYGI